MTSEVALNLDAPEVIVRAMLTTDRAVDLFLGDIRRRGYSERTRTTYSRILDKFHLRLPVDYDVSKITTDDVRRYLDTYSTKARGTQAHAESVLSSFLKWLYLDGKITKNPMDRLPRTRRIPATDLDVTTVQTDDVVRLMTAAHGWTERLTIGVLVYMGPRRRAVARLRLKDYDRANGRLRFQEKGGKIIWKPIPDELRGLLEAAITDGQYERPESYLIPPEGYLSRTGDRDDRVIWRVVKRVADRAGVEAHVHALRAAFAVFYLTCNPGDVEALQATLGHRSIATTQVYLRKLDREAAMERNRTLSWGVVMDGDEASSTLPQIAANTLASSSVVGAGGFEPPFPDFQGETLEGGQLPGETP